MFCSNCGCSNEEVAAFCKNCGMKLNHSQQQKIQQSIPIMVENSKKKSKKMIVAVIVVAIITVCVFGLIFFLNVKVGETKKGQEQNDYVSMEDVTDNEWNKKMQISDETEMKELQEMDEDVTVDDIPNLTISECVSVCNKLEKRETLEIENEDWIYRMSEIALQTEVDSQEEGLYQKLYTDLSIREKQDLDYQILSKLYWNEDTVEYYALREEYEDAELIRKDAAEEVVKDFYGERNIDWEHAYCFEEWDNEYVNFVYDNDGAWYAIDSYSIKEDGEYDVLEGAVFCETNGGDRSFVGYSKYLFEKNPNTLFGATLVYSEFIRQPDINLAIKAKASSTLDEQFGKTYVAEHLIDGNLNTCWVENVVGTGEGESIELDLGKERKVYGVGIYNGYLESKYLYQINGKVSEVQIRASDGSFVTGEFYIAEYDKVKEPIPESEYVKQGTYFKFDQPIMTDKITITILNAVSGEKYDDTCISEIRVY